MRTLLPLVAFALGAIAASRPVHAAETRPPAFEGVQMELVDPLTDQRAADAQRTALAATNYLGQKLVTEMVAALRKGPPEEAFAVAHLQTVGSEGQIVPGMPKVRAFKLTSLRLINAANHPDHAEQIVLDDVARTIRAATKPADLIVQHITFPDGSEEWRAYRPLAMLPTCVTCHGEAAGKSPRMRALLVQRASSAPATEYRPGEWRGLLRVTVEVAAKTEG